MGKDKQKTIARLHKEPCDTNNLYAKINLNAMEQAAQNLNAGAFKLWCYFAKNNPTYKNWDLSSKDASNSFGLKTSQYNTAVEELIDKNYLIEIETDSKKANLWEFYELSQPKTTKPQANDLKRDPNTETLIRKSNKPLVTESNKGLVIKSNKPSNKTSQALLQNQLRNITTTKDITKENITEDSCSVEQPTPAPSPQEPIIITQKEFIDQDLARFRVGQCIIDEEGNKIIESCGKVYKVLVTSQETSTAQ